MFAEDMKRFLEKSKYYLIILVGLVIVLISSFFFESDMQTNDKLLIFEEFVQEFWLQIIIAAFIITISLYALIQYIIVKNMQDIREKQEDIDEKAEIHNMRYGVRR